jgi:hypothetical protein
MDPVAFDARCPSFDDAATQSLAAAAHFMGFDSLLVPSARHGSHSLVIFMDSDRAVMLEPVARVSP